MHALLTSSFSLVWEFLHKCDQYLSEKRSATLSVNTHYIYHANMLTLVRWMFTWKKLHVIEGFGSQASSWKSHVICLYRTEPLQVFLLQLQWTYWCISVLILCHVIQIGVHSMFSVMSTLTFLFFSPLKFLACKRNGESVFMLNVDFKETFLFVRVINGYLHACLCSCNTKVIVQLN